MKKFVITLFILCGCVSTPETGRKAFLITSESQEAQLGAQAFSETLRKERLSSNSAWNTILQRVGQRISHAANKPDYQWEFRLIESKEPNAFCLPGGKVAFYTGIIPYLQNEAAMAAVMGHEVAHATARHGGQRMTATFGTQVGFLALGELLGAKSENSGLLMAALGMGAQVGVLLPFSRSHESEADEIGLIYMARAGYDPAEAPKFWDRFAKAGGSAPPEFLSTHPASTNRKKALEAQLPKVESLYQISPKYGSGAKF